METNESNGFENESFRSRESCAGCGAPVNPQQPECSYCLRPHRAMRKASAAGRYSIGLTDYRAVYDVTHDKVSDTILINNGEFVVTKEVAEDLGPTGFADLLRRALG